MKLLLAGGHVQPEGLCHGFLRNIKIYPLDKIILPGVRSGCPDTLLGEEGQQTGGGRGVGIRF